MRRIFIIAALLLLPVICLVAQQYPVQVTPQLVAPYSLQVSDYTSAVGSPKLNLLLLLRDFNKPSMQVRLRMSISSQSVAIATREDVSFTAIEILSGQPKYIQPTDLIEYFNSNNLTFSGITQSQYEQTGKLPEGFYTFCFEVVDVATGKTVSNKGCTIAWLTLSEPPLLNLPRKAEEMITALVQNVVFQWTPRHTASPSAYNIDYEFTLVELPSGSTTPEADFASSTVMYTETTAQTTLLYSTGKPELVRGNRYAWRVQAKAKNGTQDVAMFRNNGFSEIFWFVYQNNCPPPTNIEALAQGQRVNVTWGANTEHLDYRVEYREKNNADAEWFMLGNASPTVSITDLKPSTLYEYRVGAACEYGVYIFSPIQQFTTNNETATTVPECGIDPNLTSTDQPLLQTMNAGDIIKAGDFEVIVTEVSGQGSFTGKGYVKVSWLANMKIAVRFNNIGVATDKKLKTGTIETTYDPTESGIESLDEVISDIVDFYNNTFGSNWNQFTIDTYTGTISNVVKNPDGSVSINGSKGSETIPAGKNYIIFDNAGHTYYISEGGQVTQAEGPRGTPIGESSTNSAAQVTNAIAPNLPIIKFSKVSGTKYAIDVSEEFQQTGGKQYEKLATGAAPYFVNWKLLQTGQEEFLTATVAVEGIDETISLDSIYFKRTDGTIIPATRDGNSWPITVKGRLNLYTDALWAVVNQYPGTDSTQEKILGKISLINVDKIKKYVAIVPVNGQGAAADAAQIQSTLNEIYKPFAIEWEVTKKPNLTVPGYDINKALKVERRYLNLAYGADLNLLIDAYGRNDDDVSVMFMVNKPDPTEVDGYMGLGNKYGFLFLKGSAQANALVIAHELGHGVFQLPHIFGEADAEQGKTSNLMDYSGANARLLCMDQWKRMHDTKLIIRFGQSVDDGELASLNNMGLLEKFKENGYYTFLSPSGKLISLPETITQVTFATGDVWSVKECAEKKFDVVPFGTLTGFVLADKTRYTVEKSCATNNIRGYLKASTTNEYYPFIKYTDATRPTKAIIGIPVINDSHLDYAVGTIGITTTVPVNQDNKGDGDQQRYDFLSDKFLELYEHPNEVRFVYAALYPDLRTSKEGMKFLMENADYAKFGQQYGMYVFAHAYQIAMYPDVYNTPCGVLYDRISKVDPYEYQYQRPADATNVATISYIDEPGEYLRNTTIRWQFMKLSRYEELKNCLDEVNKLTTITDAAVIISTLEKFRDNQCVWAGMNIANRIWALKALINSDFINDSWGINIPGGISYKTYYVGKLLTTVTTVADGYAIAEALKDGNYAAIFNAFNKMDGDLLDEFVNTVTQWIIGKSAIDKEAFFASQVICGPCTNKYFHLFNERNDASQRTVFRGELYPLAHQFKFYTNNQFYHNGWPPSTIVEYTSNPYDFIGITFKDDFDYNVPGTEFKGRVPGGSRAVVPLFWAYWFQHRYKKDEGLQALRAAVDAFALMFSGGTANAALKALEISLAATDFVVTVNRNYIQNEFGSDGKEFIDIFDNSVLTVGGTIGGVLVSKGIITLGGKAVSFSAEKFGLAWSKIKTVYRELRSGDPETLLKFKIGLTKLAVGMERLVASAGQKVANLSIMYNALIDELSFIYLQEKFRAVVQNVSLSVRNTTYAVLISSGIEIQIANGKYLNGIFEFTGGYQWLGAGQAGKTIGYIEDAKYIRNGTEEVGSLELVLSNGKYYFKTADANVLKAIQILEEERGLLAGMDEAKRFETLISLNQWKYQWLKELDDAIAKYPALAAEINSNTKLLKEFKDVSSGWTGKYGVRASMFENTLTAPELQKYVNDKLVAVYGKSISTKEVLGKAFDQEYYAKVLNAIKNFDYSEVPHIEKYIDEGYIVVFGQMQIKPLGKYANESVEVHPDVMFISPEYFGEWGSQNVAIWDECKIRPWTDGSENQNTIFKLMQKYYDFDAGEIEFQVLVGNLEKGIHVGDRLIIRQINKVSVDLNNKLAVEIIYPKQR